MQTKKKYKVTCTSCGEEREVSYSTYRKAKNKGENNCYSCAQREGKYIDCKNCGDKKYLSPSRIGKRKYCSRKCAKEDDFGFTPYDKECEICGDCFEISKTLETINKYCSDKCRKEAATKRQKKYRKERAKKVLKCDKCRSNYSRVSRVAETGLCDDCIVDKFSEERQGEGNPNFKGKDGKYSYGNIHKFLNSHFGKADKCDNEKCEGDSECYEWANVSGEYTRNKDDYVMLCKSCHNNFDIYGKPLLVEGNVIEKEDGKPKT